MDQLQLCYSFCVFNTETLATLLICLGVEIVLLCDYLLELHLPKFPCLLTYLLTFYLRSYLLRYYVEAGTALFVFLTR